MPLVQLRNMRTPLALLFGSLLVGCTVVGDSGSGGDDGDATCGNGIKEGSEACDDNNTASGDGCSSTCTSETGDTPALNITPDKPTFNTQLLTTNMVTLTLQASGGFSGQVSLTPSLLDGQGNILAGWTIQLDKTAVDIPVDGSATVVATVKIPSDTRAASGTIRIDGTSSLGSVRAQAVANVTKTISFPVSLNGTQCVYPAFAIGTVRLLPGTKLRFENKDATQNITFHIDDAPGLPGVDHQPDPGTPPNMVYEQTVDATATGGTAGWYCHTKTNPNNMSFQVTP
jgi:cysteine-rich repeat protein